MKNILFWIYLGPFLYKNPNKSVTFWVSQSVVMHCDRRIHKHLLVQLFLKILIMSTSSIHNTVKCPG